MTKEKYKRVISFIDKHDNKNNAVAFDMFKGKSDANDTMYLMQISFKDREDVLNIIIREEEMVVNL